MLWFRAPEKVYIKKGCLPVALDELKNVMGKKRAFIVTDTFLYENGYTKPITDKLDEMGIAHTTFFDVQPDPTLLNAKNGAAQMAAFKPDTIIALGGGSAMDCAKTVAALLYASEDLKEYFYQRAVPPERKTFLVLLPTTAGTGAEITAKHMSCVIATNVNDEKNPLVRLIPLPIKNAVMKAVFDATGETKSCLSLSNLGAVKLPEAMMPYVKRLDFILGVQATAPYNVGVISWKDTLYINFIRNIREPELEYAFYRVLRELGIPVTAESNQNER